jgi:hypothetical protein
MGLLLDYLDDVVGLAGCCQVEVTGELHPVAVTPATSMSGRAAVKLPSGG